jgi:hypothetical protein
VTTLPSENLRATALEQAVALYSPVDSAPWWATADGLPFSVLNTADLFLAWLRAGGQPSSVRMVIGAPQDETDDTSPTMEGPAAMAGMNTGQKIKLTADPEDAAGYDVDVPVAFTVADESIVVIDNIDDDPKSVYVVSGAPGSTVVTATVTKLDGTELTGTLAVDVVPADVAVVNIVAGDPEAE